MDICLNHHKYGIFTFQLIEGGALCDSNVVGNASEYIRNIKGAADRSYTFLHLDLLDARGHAFSWCSNLYLQGVDMVDAWIGELLDAIDDDDGEEWLVRYGTGVGRAKGYEWSMCDGRVVVGGWLSCDGRGARAYLLKSF